MVVATRRRSGDGVDEFGAGAALEHVVMGARRHGAGHVRWIVEGGEHHHPDGRHVGTDSFERLQTILAGHADVEQHHIGLEFPREFDGLIATGGLAHDLHFRASEETDEPPTHHLVIIRND
jgi:hypothetical protein